MKITRAIAVGVLFVLSASWRLTSPGKLAKPAPSASEQLVGTWRLVSRVVKHPDGSSNPDPAYGPKYPIGYIMYDRTGHMAVQFMGINRPDNHSSLAYDAYFGTYTVNELKTPMTVTHHLEGSLNPSGVGKDNVRDLHINGDEMTLVVHTSTPDININTFTRVK
jgi:hypothetical protein